MNLIIDELDVLRDYFINYCNAGLQLRSRNGGPCMFATLLMGGSWRFAHTIPELH